MHGLDSDVVSVDEIVRTVESGVIPGITTEEIDVLVAETAVRLFFLPPLFLISRPLFAVMYLNYVGHFL